LAIGANDRVAPVERVVALGEVRARVRAASLLARERTAGDRADERVLAVEQRAQAVGRADEAGAARERLARVALGARRRGQLAEALQLALVGRDARRLLLAERVIDRAPSEHEALAERVGREPVGAVQPGTRRLADGVQ